MNFRRSLVLAGAALVVAAPAALASDDRPPIVNPELPAACIPPGLTKGQPKPEGWRPPPDFRPPADCFKMPLFVRAPEVEDEDDDRPAPQQGSQQGSQQGAKPQQSKPQEKPEPGGEGQVTEEGTEQADAPDAIPTFKANFFRRTWQARANVFEAVETPAGVRLDVDVDRLLGVPKALRAEAKFVRDYGAYVLVGSKTKVQIVNPEMDETFPASMDDISSDDDIRVRGRFLKQANWRTDESGDKVPTLRAFGVQIIDEDYTGEDDSTDES